MDRYFRLVAPITWKDRNWDTRPVQPHQPQDPPAEAPLRKVDRRGRVHAHATTMQRRSEAWPPPCIGGDLRGPAHWIKVAASGHLRLRQPLLGIVADSAAPKSPLYREFVRRPFGKIWPPKRRGPFELLAQPEPKGARRQAHQDVRSSTTGTTAPPWTWSWSAMPTLRRGSSSPPTS